MPVDEGLRLEEPEAKRQRHLRLTKPQVRLSRRKKRAHVYHFGACFERTKKKPLSMKWVDTDKGDQECPNYRSRPVCTEVKKAKKPGEQLKASGLFSSKR
eukprot:5525820-Amphidinium_carterae.1